MAYYDYAPDINPLDDEERKRREREIAAMAAENEPMGRGPIEPTFFDTVGQAFDQRMGDVQNRISQVGEMFSDPAAAFQQRMMGEQAQAAQDQAANTEVNSQTIKTYGDGSQERVVKTQVPAGQAQAAPQAQPAAPMMGPVAPDSPEAQQQAEQFAQAMARAQEQQARAPSLTTPIAGMPQNLPAQGQIPASAAQAAPQMASLPTPGPAVQVAGATQMPPPAAPAAPGASLAQAGQAAQAAQAAPAPVAGTPYTPTVEREVAQPKLWVQDANDAGSNLAKLFDVAAKHPESRDMIMGKMELLVKNKSKEDEANAIMKAAQDGDLKAMNKIQQAIRPETGKPKEEVTVNDYLKAVLYSRLGLNELAKQQQMKILGKETTFGQITLGNSNWQTESDSSGNIIRAKDNEGNFATTDTLNKLRAGGQKFGSQAFGFTGELATIPTGQADAGQEYRQRTNSVSGAIENVITTGPNAGKVYSGPPGAAKSVGTQYSKALNEAFIKYQTAPTTEMAKKMMEIAGQVDDGSGKTINTVMDRIRTQTPQIFNQISGGQAGTPPAPTGVGDGGAAPAATVNPQVASVQRDIVAIQNEIKRPAPAGFTPEREAQRQQVLQKELGDRQAWLSRNGGGVAAPAQGGGGGGGSLATQLKTQTEAAQEVGTDLGKIKVNQPKTEENADYLITRINELVTHPGFETSVGRKGASYGFGLTTDPIFAGTDASDWQARFKEVGGQSFLQAIENLRGLGALSNLEGEAATKAIQRMSTSQSEKEFKTAAKDFNEIIQRGVDRNREKLGQAPKYSTPAASESAKQTEAAKPKKLSADDRKALEWARQNPNTPEAAKVKERLGLGS